MANLHDDFSDVDPDELAKSLEDLDDLDSNLFGGTKVKLPASKSKPSKTINQSAAVNKPSESDFQFGDYAPSSAGTRTQQDTGRRRAVRFNYDDDASDIFPPRTQVRSRERQVATSKSDVSANDDDLASLIAPRQRSAGQSAETRQRRQTSLDWLGEDTSSNATLTRGTPSDDTRRQRGREIFDQPGRSFIEDSSDILGTTPRNRGNSSESPFNSLSPANTARGGTRKASIVAEDDTKGKEDGGTDWLALKSKLETKKPPVLPSDNEINQPVFDSLARKPPVFNQTVNEMPTKGPIAAKAEIIPPKNIQDLAEPKSDISQQLIPAVTRSDTPHHSFQNDELIKLQGTIKTLEMEIKYLKESLEQQQRNHQEEVNTLKEVHEKQIKLLEDSYQQKESTLKSGFDYRIQILESQIQRLEEDKKDIIVSHENKLQKIEDARQAEIQHMKELHKSIETTMEQLQIRTRELRSHEDQLEEKEKTDYLEKFARLELKEKQLATLESRLHRQAEATDQERGRLQQLVLRLEAHVQQQTKEVEEERWNLQQEQGKLKVRLQFLEEERKHLKIQIEQERHNLQKAKDILVDEQRNVVNQIADERKILASEKEAWEALKQTQRLDELKTLYEQKKKIADTEAQYHAILHKKEQTEEEYQRLQATVEQMRKERDSFDKEKREITLERQKLSHMAAKLKDKSEEIEHLYRAALQTREEGHTALQRAKEVEFKHHSRLQQIQNQLEVLQNQERKLVEMQKLVSEESEHFLNRGNSVCAVCQMYLNSNFGGTSLPYYLAQHPKLPFFHSQSEMLHHQGESDSVLNVWNITSKIDKDFLQEEASFLQTLGESSNSIKM